MKKAILFILMILFCVSVVQADLQSTLYAYFSFDDDLISTNESVNLTAYGDARQDSSLFKLGNASYNFDGAGDYLLTTDTVSWVSAQPYSLSFWYYKNGSSVGIKTVACHTDDTNEGPCVLASHSTDKFAAAYENGYIKDLNTQSIGSWHHAAVTYDGSNYKIFLDSRLVNQTTSTLSPKIQQWIFGGGWKADTPNYYFKGALDDIGIWHRQLSDGGCSVDSNCTGEIGILFNEGTGIAYPFLGYGLPSVSNINCTSCNIPYGDTTSPYTTNDTTPTFTFDTDIVTLCRIGDSNITYDEMNSTRNCDSGLETTDHTCTVIVDDALSSDTDYAYLRCESADNESSTKLTVQYYTNSTEAILLGVDNALDNYAHYENKQVYVMGNSQNLGLFDVIAIWGNKTWVFNYVGENESYTGMQDMSPSFYVWENESISDVEITLQVETLINNTK